MRAIAAESVVFAVRKGLSGDRVRLMSLLGPHGISSTVVPGDAASSSDARRPVRHGRSLGWLHSRDVVPAVGLCLFVTALGLLPYEKFARVRGSIQAFKSAYDEDTYLLPDLSVPYRFVSEGVVDVLRLMTPGLTGLMIAADVVIPMLVVIAAWFLVTRLVRGTGARVMCVLLLLFGQELFSLANQIVWPGREILGLHLPTTSKLVPDATTSYFTLFRTPEPGVSWVLLFGFLALVSNRDPLSAFEGKRRRLTYPLFAALGFTYVFCAIPILLISVVLCGWSFVCDGSRVRSIGLAVLLTVMSFAAAMVIGRLHGFTGSSFTFDSRAPVLTPALVAGTIVAIAFILVHGRDAFRRPGLLVPLSAAAIPVILANQQLVTGRMVSARDWERDVNYPLVIFASICLIASIDWKVLGRLETPIRQFVGVSTWIAVIYLGVHLVAWQREVYDVWYPTNLEAHATADLLDGVTGAPAGYPVALQDAGLVPFVRLLTGDRWTFILDYTRLFVHPLPTFAHGMPRDERGTHRQELFAYAFRLGWSPERLKQQIHRELDGKVGGFYSHFVFALPDVWPPITDGRQLHVDEALRRVPNVIAAYRTYLKHQARVNPGPALIVTSGRAVNPGDGRRNRLLATSGPAGPQQLRLYVESFHRPARTKSHSLAPS